MALRAKIPEHDLATARIADVFAEIRAHFGGHLLAFGIPFLTNPAERLLDRPQRVAVVALQNLSQVIRVEYALGQLVGQNGVEKLSRPGLALHD